MISRNGVDDNAGLIDSLAHGEISGTTMKLRFLATHGRLAARATVAGITT
jgi:hypothetical protein